VGDVGVYAMTRTEARKIARSGASSYTLPKEDAALVRQEIDLYVKQLWEKGYIVTSPIIKEESNGKD